MKFKKRVAGTLTTLCFVSVVSSFVVRDPGASIILACAAIALGLTALLLIFIWSNKR
jgi:hypothetical protein